MIGNSEAEEDEKDGENRIQRPAQAIRYRYLLASADPPTGLQATP
jgi:hypothetical protein